MYQHAKIEALSTSESSKGYYSVLPFDVALYKEEKKWGVFGFSKDTGSELIGIYTDIKKAREHSKKVIDEAMKEYHLSQITKVMFDHHCWLSPTPSNQWQLKYEFTEAKGFYCERNEAGYSELVETTSEEAEVWFISGVFDGNKEMVEVCYSKHEAEQLASITNFVINPVIN
ncbi:hypothetical protein L4D09_26605 [Photobacterium makurazakiensis]|uniref:hypothetical protein n=1 Tax=Photobacterium makurazakiensis TaxID=2910234 RepID=UPI003D09E13A